MKSEQDHTAIDAVIRHLQKIKVAIEGPERTDFWSQFDKSLNPELTTIGNDVQEGEAMKVSIKSFEVDMDVKTNGIEFEVYENNKDFRGDCILTKTGLIWCEGKKQRKNGKKASWNDFIEWMNER